MPGAGVITGQVAGASHGNPLKNGFITRQYLWAFSLTTSLFFLWGFAYGLLDVLNKHFQNTLHVTKLQSTGLQVAYFGVGYFAYSPVAAIVMKKYGYKKTFIMGLSLYSLGAILFWPVAAMTDKTDNKQAIFGGFVVCTAVIACGLATLEVGANSYVSIMPPVSVANFRLQFSQSFNGVASFTGPLIASKYFFGEDVKHSNNNVQYVYLAVAIAGVCVAAAYLFTKLPEPDLSDATAQENQIITSMDGSEESKKMTYARIFYGFATQFCYVGAQVTIGTFFLNYAHENGGFSDSKGSQMLSYGLIAFTVGRFVGTALLAFMSAPLLLGICTLACCALTCAISSLKGGSGGVVCLIIIMFFESVQYPIIFVLATGNMGRYTKIAAGAVVMGVSGGAVFPPIQGAIATSVNTRVSYWIALPAFIEIFSFAMWQWKRAGFAIGLPKDVIPEVAEEEGSYHGGDEKLAVDDQLDNKNEMEYVERARY